MGECRNCGAQGAKDLGFIGAVAPFFLKRVLNMEYGLVRSQNPVKRMLRKIRLFSSLCQKIYGKSVLVEIQICPACLFVQTKVPFPDEAIGRLYTDYRSDSYNQERIRYEPEYSSIASDVGSSVSETEARTIGLTRWLNGKMLMGTNFSMLDYGGADGKFLPSLPGQKYVFDICDIAPAGDVIQLKDESALRSYSYVQLAHVLEHVSYPLRLTKKAASFLKDAGYLYIEVPQELSDEDIGRMAKGDNSVRVDIHEHINRYSVKAVTELMRAAGLSLTAIQDEVLDLGWIKAKIIRALGKK